MAFSSDFKRSLFAGLVIVVPVLVTGFVLVWLATLIEGLMKPVLEWVLGESLPGLGFFTALALVTAVGIVATTVVGGKLLDFGESLLTRIPVFKDIYVPVKQLVTAFSPENESGFKKVVLIPGQSGTRLLGFLTREFDVTDENGELQSWAAVYVPTNHLYLGDILCFPRADLLHPDLSVQEGVRIILTGGTSFPSEFHLKKSGRGVSEDESKPSIERR